MALPQDGEASDKGKNQGELEKVAETKGELSDRSKENLAGSMKHGKAFTDLMESDEARDE